MINLSVPELLTMNGRRVEVETEHGKALDTVQVMELPLQEELGPRIYFENCEHIGLSRASDCNDCIEAGEIKVRLPSDYLTLSDVIALDGHEVEVITNLSKARGVVRVLTLPDDAGTPEPVVVFPGLAAIGLRWDNGCNDGIIDGDIIARRT